MLISSMEQVIGQIDSFVPPSPLDHRRSCCRAAFRWLMTRSVIAQDSWIDVCWSLGEHLPWGPSSWPTSWCSLIRADTFDGMAAAAAAELVLAELGLKPERVQALIDTAATGEIARQETSWPDNASGLTYVEGISIVGDLRVVLPQDGRELVLGEPWRHGRCVATRRWSASSQPFWEVA